MFNHLRNYFLPNEKKRQLDYVNNNIFMAKKGLRHKENETRAPFFNVKKSRIRDALNH